MERVGHYRQKLVTFLTDGKRWQFFLTKRSRDDPSGLCYEASKIVDDVQQGWNILWTLLQQEVSNLGYSEPKVEGVVLHDPLGRGSSSTVYEGVRDNERVVVKIYGAEKSSAFHAEKRALEKLNHVAGVPNIRYIGTVLDAQKFHSHVEALVSTPVAKDLRTDKCRIGIPVDGRHLKQLVQIVKQAHDQNLLHRDIKPNNCFLGGDTNFILNDWGASRLTSESPNPWQGSVGFSVTPDQQTTNGWDDKACDLVAVVRTAYVLFCKESPPTESWAEAIDYWNKQFRDGSGWKAALGHALNTNYEELGKILLYLK